MAQPTIHTYEAIADRLARLETKQEMLANSMKHDIEEMKKSLDILTALANRGQGSIKTFLYIGGAITGLVAVANTVLHWGN